MDAILLAFINLNYSPESAAMIRGALQTLSVYGTDLDDEIMDLICNEDTEPSAVSDSIRSLISKSMDDILIAHTVIPSHEASFQDRLMLIEGLLVIQDLEDFTPVITIIESLGDTEELFAHLMSHVCTIDIVYIMTAVDTVDQALLDKLLNLAYFRTNTRYAPSIDVTIRDTALARLKTLHKHVNRQLVGLEMLTLGFSAGMELPVYIPYSGINFTDTTTPIQILAEQFLSLIYLSTPEEDPVAVYRNCGASIFGNVNSTTKVGEIIQTLSRLK
jgi:hypothetical protein